MQPFKKPKGSNTAHASSADLARKQGSDDFLAENIAPFCKIVSINNKGILEHFF